MMASRTLHFRRLFVILASLALSATCPPASGAPPGIAYWYPNVPVLAYGFRAPHVMTGENFDTDGLADQLEGIGARYLFITVGQLSGFFCAPN